MSDATEYTLADIVEDSRLSLIDWEDIFDDWTEALPTSRKSVVTDFDKGKDILELCGNDDEFLTSIRRHLESLRFLSFAMNSLNAESEKYKTQLLEPVNKTELMNQLSLQKCPMEKEQLLSSLPFSIQVKNVIKSEQVLTSSNDTSSKQLKKDIERDRIIINGLRIVGADGGIDRIQSILGETIDTLLYQCNLPTCSQQMKDMLCPIILRKVSRTNSGGLTFQILQQLLNIQSTMIVPVSTLAKPLRIKISINKYPTNGSGSSIVSSDSSSIENNNNNDDNNNVSYIAPGWGLVCQVEAMTVFRIQNIVIMTDESPSFGGGGESEEDAAVQVRAIFSDMVLVDIDPRARPELEWSSGRVKDEVGAEIRFELWQG